MDTPLLRYTVSIDCAKAHQTIDNFGASDCWSMQMEGDNESERPYDSYDRPCAYRPYVAVALDGGI
jgi:hypothetical protein